MKLKLLYSIVSVLMVCFSFGQSLELISEFEVKGTNIEVDRLGNVYTYQNEEIWKYNSKGDSLFFTSNKMLGEVTSLDLTLTMRPLVFYRNSNRVVLYDNTLTEQTDAKIELEKLTWQQVNLVAASFNNNQLWLYDNSNFEVLQIDKQLTILQQSGNLNQVAGIENFSPQKMLEISNNLFLADSAHGILVFDLFGTYYNTLHITGFESLTKTENLMLYVKNGTLYIYNTLLFDEKSVALPFSNFDDCKLIYNHLYLLKENKVMKYKISVN